MRKELRDFFLCRLDDVIEAAQVADSEGPLLPLDIRYLYAISPINLREELAARYFALFVRQHAESGSVRLLVKVHQTANSMSRSLSEDERLAVTQRISRLEQLYSVIDTYRWLGTRFGDEIFVDMTTAEATALSCAREIEVCISKLGGRIVKKGSIKR